MDGGQTQGAPTGTPRRPPARLGVRSAALPEVPAPRPTRAAPRDGPGPRFRVGLRGSLKLEPGRSEVGCATKVHLLVALGALGHGGTGSEQIARREQTGALDWVGRARSASFRTPWAPPPLGHAPSAPPAWVLNLSPEASDSANGPRGHLVHPRLGAGPGPGRRQSAVRGVQEVGGLSRRLDGLEPSPSPRILGGVSQSGRRSTQPHLKCWSRKVTATMQMDANERVVPPRLS